MSILLLPNLNLKMHGMLIVNGLCLFQFDPLHWLSWLTLEDSVESLHYVCRPAGNMYLELLIVVCCRGYVIPKQ